MNFYQKPESSNLIASDWLEIRSGHGILIYSARQGLINVERDIKHQIIIIADKNWVNLDFLVRVNAGDRDHDLWYRLGPLAERRVSMRHASHWSRQQQHLLQRLQALGAQEMQWAQALVKGPMIIDVYGAWELHTPWTADQRSPSWTWQAGGGSFLLLPRRHALSTQWLWTFNHNTCENPLEEVQGAATSSVFSPPLFQDTWQRVQLLCVDHNAPCQWDLAIDKPKPPTSAVELQGIRQICNVKPKTLSPSGPMSYLRGLALRISTLFWKREGSTGMDMWNAPMLQSRQPVTYRLMESVGLGGPRWHGNSWQRGIAERGSSGLSTLTIDTPRDLMWGLPCVQQASFLEGGQLMWMMPLYLHVKFWW